jgi:hypothetical protein
MNPVPGDVHVNTPLTNISIAFLQSAENFVATRVFPNIPVTKQGDRYYTFDRGEFNRDEAEERAPGTESAGGSYTLDNTPTYFANVYAFHKDIPDQVRANADAVLDPDREATEYVTHKALIKREKDLGGQLLYDVQMDDRYYRRWIRPDGTPSAPMERCNLNADRGYPRRQNGRIAIDRFRAQYLGIGKSCL